MPSGPGRRDHAVERAVHALDLEDRAGARGRLDGDPQAGRVVAALVLAARRPRRRGRASRRASSTSCRGSARRSAPRSSRTPASAASRSPARPRRHGTSASPRRGTSSPSPASSAARGRCSSSTTAISRRRRGRPPGSSTTRARSASPARGSSCRSRVAEPFLELFHRFADEHVLGDPRDDATTVTPLIHRDHFDRVAGFVERARANGDEIVRGGHPAERGGLFYEPTLVVPRSNESEIVQREVFGPVLTFQTFRDEDEGDRARELDPVRALGRSSTRARPSAPSGSAGRSAPARSGSTRSSCATSRRRSAGSGSRASAARAATSRSTSTPT